MQIVIADDDAVARRLAHQALEACGHPLVHVEDGEAAWHLVRQRAEAQLLVLDRGMPGLDGLEVVRRTRQQTDGPPVHIVMVTAAGRAAEIAEGFDAGADDYLVKPYNHAELRARVNVGLRLLLLQEHLAKRVDELEQALRNVKQLRGLLPMCSYCKKVRVDEQYWQQVEGYIADHTDATFTHGICPSCLPAALADTGGE